MNTDRPTGDDHTLTDAERVKLAVVIRDGLQARRGLHSFGMAVPIQAAEAIAESDWLKDFLAGRAGKDAAAVAAARAAKQTIAQTLADMEPVEDERPEQVATLRWVCELLAALDVAPPTTDHDTLRREAARFEHQRSCPWFHHQQQQPNRAAVSCHCPYRGDNR